MMPVRKLRKRKENMKKNIKHNKTFVI